MNKRIKLFTDGDMDGAGGAIVAILRYGRNNLDIEYGREINDKVEKLIDTGYYKEYDQIHIVDTLVNKEIAEKIDALEDNNFYLFDHHATSKFLNDYKWALVLSGNYKDIFYDFYEKDLLENIQNIKNVYNANESEDNNNGHKISGAMVYYLVIYQFDDILNYNFSLQSLVLMISDYDTYTWKENKDTSPKLLQNLFSFYGREKFIETMIYNVKFDERILTSKDNEIAMIVQSKEESYIENQLKKIKLIDIGDNKIGILFADKYISELGNRACEENDILFVIIINLTWNKVDLRSTGEYDVSEYAKFHNGGGHLKAAGFPLTKEYLFYVLKDIDL